MSEKQTTHERVTAAIIEHIEAGISGDDFVLPWQGQKLENPFNALTAAKYRGINSIILWIVQMRYRFKTAEFATFKQWKEKGANVRKGSKGFPIVFYKEMKKENEDGEEESYFVARSYTVFNADQVEGYEPKEATPDPTTGTAELIESCDAFIAGIGANIHFEGCAAFYQPSTDIIKVPPLKFFKASKFATATENFYSTCFHELTHWSGSEKRLAREGLRPGITKADYAFEELVAELGAAMLCAELGVTTTPREDHAAYIAGWLKALKSDPRYIFKAAAKAQAATDYLCGLSQNQRRKAA